MMAGLTVAYIHCQYLICHFQRTCTLRLAILRFAIHARSYRPRGPPLNAPTTSMREMPPPHDTEVQWVQGGAVLR
ncbi:hypothetical protein BC835DRAFT_814603 [Cytidiella melzeri]|nr:hypothetical protein BC835DRAFT_814603 [Cytidiella melzeri]